MSDFRVGFARVNVTPPMGLEMEGYYVERHVEGVLDELEADAVAFSCAGRKAVVISLDSCLIVRDTMEKFRARIAEDCGLEPEASCRRQPSGLWMTASRPSWAGLWGRRPRSPSFAVSA